MYLRKAIRIKVPDDRRRDPASAEAALLEVLKKISIDALEKRYRLAGPATGLCASDEERCVAANLYVTPEEWQRLVHARRHETADWRIVANPSIAPLSVWTPALQGGGTFGDQTGALAALAATPSSDFGAGVNVAVIDFGIDETWLQRYRKGQKIEGGWPRKTHDDRNGYAMPGHPPLPLGLSKPSDHAHMIVRNILSIAPAVRIFDVPLLPETTLGPPGVQDAESMFLRIWKEIREGKQDEIESIRPETTLPSGPWILCNAWGVLDPFRDPEFAPYWRCRDHSLLRIVEELSKARVAERNPIDVVFAAGNCGLPGAQPRCAEMASGPGVSIHGANAHEAVLTVGAARVDGLPIGGSAVGPGILAGSQATPSHPDFGQDSWAEKPDVCAPSYFRDSDDAALLNTGTSAACGLAVGVLAALRGLELSKNKPHKSSAEMRSILRETAQRPKDAPWDPRLGWGMINLRAAREKLGV